MPMHVRFSLAGAVCLSFSVLAAPGIVLGNGECEPNLSCSTQPTTMRVEEGCSFTVPDVTGLVVAEDTCPEFGSPLELTQDPAAGTVIEVFGDGISVRITARKCLEGDMYCSERSCYLFIPISPVLQCPDSPQEISADANCQGTVPDLTEQVVLLDCCGRESARTTCGFFRVTQLPEAGTMIPLGETNVILTIERCYDFQETTFATGPEECMVLDHCEVTLNVVDDSPPTIVSCPEDLSFGADEDCEGVIPDLTAPPLEGLVATDNCTEDSEIVITQDPPAGSTIGLGTTILTVTATDQAGNSASCEVTVFLEENGCQQLGPPAPQPAPCDPNLNLLYSLIFHSPTCMPCPLMLAVCICGITALKIGHRAKRSRR